MSEEEICSFSNPWRNPYGVPNDCIKAESGLGFVAACIEDDIRLSATFEDCFQQFIRQEIVKLVRSTKLAIGSKITLSKIKENYEN